MSFAGLRAIRGPKRPQRTQWTLRSAPFRDDRAYHEQLSFALRVAQLGTIMPWFVAPDEDGGWTPAEWREHTARARKLLSQLRRHGLTVATRVGWIDDVLIPYSRRGGGLGRLLIAALERAALDRGAQYMFLFAGATLNTTPYGGLDESPVEFYRRCGYSIVLEGRGQARWAYMIKRLR